MRIDKLTTKFQEALSDAQTLALGNDHAYIDTDGNHTLGRELPLQQQARKRVLDALLNGPL